MRELMQDVFDGLDGLAGGGLEVGQDLFEAMFELVADNLERERGRLLAGGGSASRLLHLLLDTDGDEQLSSSELQQAIGLAMLRERMESLFECMDAADLADDPRRCVGGHALQRLDRGARVAARLHCGLM